MLKSKKLCLHHLDIPLVIPKSSKTKCFHKKCGFAAKYTLRDFSIISPFESHSDRVTFETNAIRMTSSIQMSFYLKVRLLVLLLSYRVTGNPQASD